MERSQIQCGWEQCSIWFIPKTYNGKYCSPECQRAATNAKTLRQYHEKKAIRQGKKRICQTLGCETVLSRYNSGNICQGCMANKENEKKNQLLEQMNAIFKKA